MSMKPSSALATSVLAMVSLAYSAAAQTAPPAPVLVAPASGASLVQPITLDWNAVVDPDGPIGSYSWQVGTTSGFTTIIAAGATNLFSDDIPAPTADKVSGLPNGTYFWRVKATQLVGGAQGSIESAWSAVRSFTVTGLGPAPTGIPSFSTPATGARFHVREFFDIKWSAVPGAHYYRLEVDDEPAFSHPLTLTTTALNFGTQFGAGWGNAIPNIYYRVRAVSADNVRGLPSATLNVHITNAAPVPPPPSLVSPAGGATVSLPFTFDWSDMANPQIPGYDLDVDTDPAFDGDFGVLLVQNISRSDYMLVSDLAPGNYFWRVRAIHGDVLGPWSAGRAITVTASPSTPPDLDLFWIIAGPGSVSGGNSTQARLTLNAPAPPGGARVTIASDLPHANLPGAVTIPAGKTDANVFPITTIPVPGAVIGTIRAAYGGGWQQSSLGLFPLVYGTGLSAESIVGGNSVTGTVTLLGPASAGGATIRLVSSDTSLVRPPATVFIPAGGTDADFTIATSAVSVPTHVVIDTGTDNDGYRAPEAWLVLRPPGGPAPAPSLASLILNQSSVLGGGTATGTLRLTAPAPPGGAAVWLNGSMEGEVVTPSGGVTVPAGSISANFTMTAPQVVAKHWVLIQARYGTSGGSHARVLQINPGPPGPATLLAIGPASQDVIGGNPGRATVGLRMPAPAGGGVVNLSTDNPSVIHVPATVAIAEGNSANSFAIATSPVSGLTTGGNVFATAGGVTKSIFVNVAPDPNAPPLLQSMTITPASVNGGTSATGTVFLSAPAPSGGISVTLSTSNSSAAQAPGIVTVPGGQTSANFTVTTFAVSNNTSVTITAFYDTTRSATLTVTQGAAPSPTPGTPTLLSPANDAQPTQPITLDWSNATNAASYRIQIDDSSNFAAPLVRNLTSTASQISVTGLSSVQHWWRVRALNSSGVAGNWSASRRFTPQGAPAAASLSTVSVSPASVIGGNSSQGTVTLSSGAPSGGAVVSLSSSNTAVATVPASVTIPAGATSANFAVTSRTVTTSTAVTITATYNSVSRNATLTVNPAPTGPLPAPSLSSPANDARFSPGQNITFNWSDVSGAASYTIQIDDQDTFPSPFIVNQTVTASQFSSSTLPTRRMWWRARANDASGNPGNWSAVRRFEVKN